METKGAVYSSVNLALPQCSVNLSALSSEVNNNEARKSSYRNNFGAFMQQQQDGGYLLRYCCVDAFIITYLTSLDNYLLSQYTLHTS